MYRIPVCDYMDDIQEIQIVCFVLEVNKLIKGYVVKHGSFFVNNSNIGLLLFEND